MPKFSISHIETKHENQIDTWADQKNLTTVTDKNFPNYEEAPPCQKVTLTYGVRMPWGPSTKTKTWCNFMV